MTTTTTTYNFNTPTPGTEEDNWGGLLNANWDAVDDVLDGTTQIARARLTTYSLSGTAIDPDNGNIQYKTISGNTTFSESFAEGDNVLLILTDADSYTINWPTMEWIGGASPSFTTAKEAVSLFKVNSTLIGNYLGPVS